MTAARMDEVKILGSSGRLEPITDVGRPAARNRQPWGQPIGVVTQEPPAHRILKKVVNRFVEKGIEHVAF